jgi:hypothetical protein
VAAETTARRVQQTLEEVPAAAAVARRVDTDRRNRDAGERRAKLERASSAAAEAVERALEEQTSLAQLNIEDSARRQGEARAAAAGGGMRWEEDERGREAARNGDGTKRGRRRRVLLRMRDGR